MGRAAISPDGRFAAGVLRESSASGRVILGIVELETGVVVTFPDAAPATGTGGIAWSADGRSLYYTTAERANLWKRPVAGGPPERVTSYSDLVIARFALAPGGRAALLFRGSPLRDAFLLTNFN